VEALHAIHGEKIVQDDKAGLGDILSKILDYVSSSADHCVFDTIRKQFFRRIFHYLAASLLDALCQERGNSYGVGIQLKMILTRIEEWARAKIGSEYGQIANEELDPAREAANVLCILKKDNILDESTRNAVCPLLRPLHLKHLLLAYKPDQFDQEVIPGSLIKALDQLQLSFVPGPKSFNPSARKPLDLNFEMRGLDLSNITLPKLVADRSGFSFLKSNIASSLDNKPVEKW